MAVAKSIYRLTETFPSKEEYRMTSQLIRAAISIPANIAEGNSRGSRKDYAHFVSIARGSSAELETLLLLSRDVGLAPEKEIDAVIDRNAEVGRMLHGLRRSLSTPAT